MGQKLVFLSHIHEERELAKIVKGAIEDEFSGFVDVFVSSDGESIPAGANFLKRIEDGLVNCIGAVYLISPISVKRSWINFELGAIWIRSCVSERNGGEEIPTLPFCHSGMAYESLPQPICNLNAIQASVSSQLEFAFKSIQNAVGAKGRLRTDFNELALEISKFEDSYTVGDKVKKLNKVFNGRLVLSKAKKLNNGKYYIELGCIPKETYQQAKALIPQSLVNDLSLMMDGCGLWECDNGDSFIGGQTDLILTETGYQKFSEILG